MSEIKSGESNGVVEVTPSGIPVYYQSRPKRLYRIRINRRWGSSVVNDEDLEWLLGSAQREAGGWAEEGWREIPGVTTVLGVLDKPALPFWGMKIGADGVRQLAALRNTDSQIAEWITSATMESLVDELTAHKLTVNHQRDRAGDRGQAVHDALEAWARYGHMPDPSIYPEEQEGYVRGLVEFLKDVPSAEPVGAEVLVASREYGYAGRYDLRMRTSKAHDVVVRRTATKIRRRELPAGMYLADLKTSKAIYGSHARQLEAYEQASVESGHEPTDGRGVLLVTPDGGYEFKRSWATFEDFRVVLDVWNSDQEMAKRKKAA